MSNKLLTILVIIMSVIVLVGGIFMFLFIKSSNDATPKTLSIDEIIVSSVDIPEITTNLSDKHYVKVQFKIQTDSEDAASELTKRDFQVNNLIIQELSDMTTDDLEGKDGKLNLEEALKSQINELMKDGSVEKVYITSYILQ